MAKSETEGKSGERESKGWLVTYDRFEYARSREAAWEQARRFAAKLDLSVNAVAKAEGFVMGDDAAGGIWPERWIRTYACSSR